MHTYVNIKFTGIDLQIDKLTARFINKLEERQRCFNIVPFKYKLSDIIYTYRGMYYYVDIKSIRTNFRQLDTYITMFED